jgi:hypothetical protein
MALEIFSEIIVVLHFLWVLFLILGILFVLRRSIFTWLHISGLLFSILINFMGWYCPLTYLENCLYYSGNSNGHYDTSFIAHYLMPVIYPDVTEIVIRVGGIIFVLIYLMIYALLGIRFLKERKRQSDDKKKFSHEMMG